MRFIFFLFLLYSPLVSTCQPNTDTAITRARIDRYYLTSFAKDYREIFTSPCKPTVQKCALGIAYAGATILLVSKLDLRIYEFAQEHRSPVVDELSKRVFEPTGSGQYLFPAVIALYAQGLVFKNQKSKKVSMNCLKSFVVASTFAQVAKYSFSRQRPTVDPADPHHWFTGNNDKSFFSGHTTTAFSIATVVAEEYRSTVWVPMVCYTLAGGVGLSRIYDNKHWASDVLTGALVGYLTGRLAVRTNTWGIEIVPRLIVQP